MMAPVRTASVTVVSLILSVATNVVVAQNTANFDQFTYGSTDTSDDNNRIYGPEDWGRVRCPDLDSCMGWPEDWVEGRGWELGTNHCRDCPADRPGRCGSHHQSPIDLVRNVAVIGDRLENECIDVHWMAYHDSSCTFEELQANNAFSIERYALKVGQPVVPLGGDDYRNGCYNEGRRWGKIDFSKGFSHWWHFSHMDFHVPSEHTQMGKRYDGEIHMYHWYSVTGEEAGINNEMASVTFFLEAYDDTPDFDMLNRHICEWRAVEEETREQCGLESVATEYPGCFFYRRGHEQVVQTQSVYGGRKRHLRQSNATKTRDEITMAHHIFEHNWKYGSADNTTFNPKKIVMSDEDFETPEVDWDEFIAQQYENERSRAGHRHLVNYEHVGPFHNYWPLIGVKTEYYYRYSGSQTIPPCYGRRIDNAQRRQTNHWRVMKDPIRVSHRQIAEMHRLLKERIAPINDPIRACQPDTATIPDPDDPNKVWGARPLQSWDEAHHKTFCECQDWGSKWEEDRAWCRIRDQQERYFQHPYNFETDGF